MTVSDIPTLNAALNATATVLITAGFIFIKTGRRDAHRRAMLSACVVSAIFLIGYVYICKAECRNTGRIIEFCSYCRTTVAGIATGRASTCKSIDNLCLRRN